MSVEWEEEAIRLLTEAERLRGTQEDATPVLYRLQEMGLNPPAGEYTVMLRESPVMHARILSDKPDA